MCLSLTAGKEYLAQIQVQERRLDGILASAEELVRELDGEIACPALLPADAGVERAEAAYTGALIYLGAAASLPQRAADCLARSRPPVPMSAGLPMATAEERRRAERRRRQQEEQARLQRERELRELRASLDRWRQELACLEEGKRKYPRMELSCHGNFMIGSRDGHIERLRRSIRNAEQRLAAAR